jgi:hypothetical protein
LSLKKSCHIGLLTILLFVLLVYSTVFCGFAPPVLSSSYRPKRLRLCPRNQDCSLGRAQHLPELWYALSGRDRWCALPGVAPTRGWGRSIRACYLIHTILMGEVSKAHRFYRQPPGWSGISARGWSGIHQRYAPRGTSKGLAMTFGTVMKADVSAGILKLSIRNCGVGI